MSRWAPDARERLEAAALDLFAENGYEETTVAQIADRAGLNRATFFRHFADKREVLFGGEDMLAGLFADAIRAAAPEATIIERLQAAFAAAEVATTRGSGPRPPSGFWWSRRTANCRNGDCSSTPGSPGRSAPPCANGAQTG